MENSIEEDIKILESIIKINNDYLKGIENQTINQKEIKALEHILSDYKKVLKENEQLRTEMNSLKEDMSNMYDEEVVISIISDNFNVSRNEVLELLESEE